MKELERTDEDGLKRPECRLSAVSAPILPVVEAGLDHLDIPVAELIPYEVVDLLHRDAQLEALHVVRDLTDNVVVAGQNPAVLGLKSLRQLRGEALRFVFHVHHDEAARIPHLVGEVA